MTKDICVTVDVWKKKRQRTFISYCVMTSIIGLEYGIFPATILSYLQEGLHAENADLWFGMITASYFISSIICCLVITRYTDRTRNVKKTLIISCIFVAFGNFLYSIPSYAFVILIARLIQGIADSLLPIIQGEIIRFYEEEERLHKLSIVTMCYYMSYIGGPVVTTIFSGVDFEIFGARFKVYNFPFLLVGFQWTAFVLVIFFFVSDLSKKSFEPDNSIEYGLYSQQEPSSQESLISQESLDDKEEPTAGNQGSSISQKSSNNQESLVDQVLLSSQEPSIGQESSTTLSPTSSIFIDNRITFIMIITFICCYFAASFNAIRLPTICKELYDIPVNYIGLLCNLEAITFGLTVYVINKIRNENCEVYFIVFGMCFMMMGLQVMSLTVLLHRLKTLGISLLVVFAVFDGASLSAEQIFLVALLGRIVPSSVQGYAAGVRRTTCNLSFICGAFISPFLHDFLFGHVIVMSFSIFILVAIFLYSREHFIQ